MAALDVLLAALHPERGAAAARYEELRAILIRYFSIHGSLVPEENADDVLNRVARKLSEGAQLDLRDHNGYFLSVARFVQKEYFRQARHKFVPLDELVYSLEGADDAVETSIRLRERIEREVGLEAILQCKRQLREIEQQILNVYDGDSKGLKIERRNDLAARLGKNVGAVRTEVSRIKKKLRECAVKKLREAGILLVL